ncbi:TolC family protein [Longitalea luteola]|uniref:TolC family protein n=1 Tax=Longitalea luteola TaxID=2812563 RepID=UPI001A97664D|nr:TolC family protein [Longitalea luteola]
MNLKKKIISGLALLLTIFSAEAQTRTISLEEAVSLGVQNSKQLQLSQNKIEQAVSQLEQAKDESLPTAKVSAGYSHALMLQRSFALPASDGSDPKSMKFPFDNTLYQATLSINQPIIAGHRYRYARESANLLIQSSKLDAEANKDEIVYNVINAYINFYKIQQNQKIVAQNLQDVDQKLTEIKKFESQGLATKNDVLRFQLQRSNIQLQQIELENNRKVVNYNLNILLGLPDSTTVQVQDVVYKLDMTERPEVYMKQALQDRKEFSSLNYQDKLADVNIKKVHDEKLPTVGVGGNLYYINPTKALFPKGATYLAPFVVGVNASWDITGFFKNRNKLTEANLQKQEVATTRDLLTDRVKMDVNKTYTQYQQALEKIKVLNDAVVQATENERITESKFRNNLATTTDRIDAQTLLYESRLNLELAKADATAAYYTLLKTTGHIQP